MNEYAIWYVPAFHNFTRLVTYVKARNAEVAEMKFWLKYEEEAISIIEMERIR